MIPGTGTRRLCRAGNPDDNLDDTAHRLKGLYAATCRNTASFRERQRTEPAPVIGAGQVRAVGVPGVVVEGVERLVGDLLRRPPGGVGLVGEDGDHGVAGLVAVWHRGRRPCASRATLCQIVTVIFACPGSAAPPGGPGSQGTGALLASPAWGCRAAFPGRATARPGRPGSRAQRPGAELEPAGAAAGRVVDQQVDVPAGDGVVGERARPGLGLRGARRRQQFLGALLRSCPGAGTGISLAAGMDVRVRRRRSAGIRLRALSSARAQGQHKWGPGKIDEPSSWPEMRADPL